MKTITLLLCLLALSGLAQKKDIGMLLAGKTYTIEITETGLPAGKAGAKKPAPKPDEISFKAGKMKSTYWSKENTFGPAEYEVSVDSSREEGAVAFVCESVNKGGEALTWEGITMPDGAVKGTIKLSKKGKIKKEYVFSGTLKTKKKK